MSKHLILLSILLLSPILFSGIASATLYYLSSCSGVGVPLAGGTPENPNTYVLQNNIATGGNIWNGACLILQSNTILDLNGYNATATFYRDMGDTSNYGIKIEGQNVTVKNGGVYALIGGFTRETFAIFAVVPPPSNILITNVTARAESTHYLSHYSFAIYLGDNVTVEDSIFTSDVCCAGRIVGDYGRITNSLINVTDSLDVDIWLTGNYNYIRACFDAGSIVNTGIDNDVTRTCPAPIYCSCGAWSFSSCYNSTHRTQTKTCTPDLCDIEIQYVPDGLCQTPSKPLEVFFNKYIVFSIFILGIAMAIALSVENDRLIVFLTVISILIFMLAVVGLFPKWIIILVIVAVGGIFSKIVMSLFGK